MEILWALQISIDVLLVVGCAAFVFHRHFSRRRMVFLPQASMEQDYPTVVATENTASTWVGEESIPLRAVSDPALCTEIPGLSDLQRRRAELLRELEVNLEKALNFQMGES